MYLEMYFVYFWIDEGVIDFFIVKFFIPVWLNIDFYYLKLRIDSQSKFFIDK